MIAWIHEGKYPADKSIFEGILYDCDDILVPPDVDISNLYRLIDCFKGTATAASIYGKENNRWGYSSIKDFGLKMGDEKKKAKEEEEAIVKSKEAARQANEAMEKANEAVRKMSAMLEKVQHSVNKVTSHEPIDTSNETFAKMSAMSAMIEKVQQSVDKAASYSSFNKTNESIEKMKALAEKFQKTVDRAATFEPLEKVNEAFEKINVRADKIQQSFNKAPVYGPQKETNESVEKTLVEKVEKLENSFETMDAYVPGSNLKDIYAELPLQTRYTTTATTTTSKPVSRFMTTMAYNPSFQVLTAAGPNLKNVEVTTPFIARYSPSTTTLPPTTPRPASKLVTTPSSKINIGTKRPSLIPDKS